VFLMLVLEDNAAPSLLVFAPGVEAGYKLPHPGAAELQLLDAHHLGAAIRVPSGEPHFPV
jgi:hypothetical protein